VTSLLDTRTLRWFDRSPADLSQVANTVLANTSNVVSLSVGSVWERVIKATTKKLVLTGTVEELVARQLANHIRLLPVTPDHPYRIPSLPSIHRDPFDRLLIAQALVEGAVLLTPDPEIHKYPVPVLW
jgi:PIN domain nuclease of toxin-antitoxin system